MSKKDTSKQDIRSLLLRNGTLVPSAYVAGSGGKMSKEDSMKIAIAARKNSFTQQQKAG